MLHHPRVRANSHSTAAKAATAGIVAFRGDRTMEWTAKALARATGTDTDLDELKIGRDLLWSRMLLSLVAAMAFGPDVWGLLF